MKKTLFYIMFMLLSFSLVLAHEEDMMDAKKIIESGISCNDLTEEELEHIGDYIMETMHPGEAHEIMDEMMGGEGSKTLKQAHINMAYRFYCNKNLRGGGMMGMMANLGYGMMGYGTMGGYGYGLLAFVVWILVIIILVLLIIWLYQKITEKRR